jgi:uncharacterized protein (UPF0264 family)
MTALLASVRSADEAFDAAGAGAELIDLKEPRAGALGALDAGDIMHIVRELHARYPVRPISATIGDIPVEALEIIATRVMEMNDAGVDYVKVGITPGPAAERCLQHLASLPAAVVPVLLCDAGVDAEVDEVLVAQAAQLGFAGVMFDTMHKNGLTLFDCVDAGALAQWMKLVTAHGGMTGLAGSLGWAHLAQIRALAPDVAGFRTALCTDGRRSRLDPQRVAKWAHALHHAAEHAETAPAGTLPGEPAMRHQPL